MYEKTPGVAAKAEQDQVRAHQPGLQTSYVQGVEYLLQHAAAPIRDLLLSQNRKIEELEAKLQAKAGTEEFKLRNEAEVKLWDDIYQNAVMNQQQHPKRAANYADQTVLARRARLTQ